MNAHRTLALALSCTLALTFACDAEPGVLGHLEGPLSTAFTTLNTWYDARTGDTYTTTDPAWRGTPGATKDGYTWMRREGLVFIATDPQPRDTVTLFQWHSPSRDDHFLTSDPAWAGAPGATKDGYTLLRREGYAYATPRAGTLALASSWHAGSADNAASTDPIWDMPLGGTRNGYTHYRDEGWVVIDATGDAVTSTIANRDQWNVATLKVNGKEARGERPLLAVMLSASDVPAPSRIGTETMLFGPSTANIRDYYLDMSRGLFTWKRAGVGVVGPYALVDDPATSGDESTEACQSDLTTCQGFAWITLATSAAACGGSTCWVGAANGGGGAVTANTPTADFQHELTIVDGNGGTLDHGDPVGLRGYSGQYFRAASGGGGGVLADQSSLTATATFTLQRAAGAGPLAPGDVVSFRASSGAHFLQAALGGGGAVDARATSATSAARFTFARGMNTPAIVRFAMQQAVAGGFDLAPYDTNRDRRITSDELALVVVLAGSKTNAGVRAYAGVGGCFATGGYNVCGDAILTSAASGLNTTAHELSHYLGISYELYDAGCSLSQNLSLMTCTDANPRFHLDPYHKMILGWTTPRVYRLDQPASAVQLAAPTAEAILRDSVDGRPILLYDPRRPEGKNRYFLIEHRLQTGYDNSIPATGIVVWDVQIAGPNGGPVAIPSGLPGAGSLEIVASPRNGTGSTVWPIDGSTTEPRWWDGDLSGVSIRAKPVMRGLVTLEWTAVTGTAGSAFTPRLDSTSVSHAPPGTRVRLIGHFGGSDASLDQVQMKRGTSIVRARIVASTRGTIDVDIPAGTARGTYDLSFIDGWGNRASNVHTFTVD